MSVRSSVSISLSRRQVVKRWPHIKQYLRVRQDGRIDDDFPGWNLHNGFGFNRADEAAACEEWADFYGFRFEQRADELADDPGLRDLVDEWTDSMAYCLRRWAAYARGEDPGKAVPQWERRPDLYASRKSRVAATVAERQSVRHLYKVS